MKLSVAMITRNEERILETTLSSVASIADEIVIVDSGSVDKTEEIALKFGAKFYREDWKGYGPQRNSAIDKCKGEWILNIDADEEISEALQNKIRDIKESEQEKRVFSINFMSVCFGKEIKHGGWSHFHRIRLFMKDSGRFNDNEVHEQFVTKDKIYFIDEIIRHYTYMTLSEYYDKFNRYSTQGAIEYHKRGKKFHWYQILIHPAYTFIKMYFLRLGFLDGIEGYLLAYASAQQTMAKYYKLREIEIQK